MTNKKGFTLGELMIVVAVIAIIAAIAIPSLLRARIAANESSAIASLRAIVTAQAQFKNQKVVDQDANGTGEYGLLGELAGTCNFRTSTAPVNPAFITASLGPLIGAEVTKSGYIFKMFLPSTGGDLCDNGILGQVVDFISAPHQENKFRAYGWPVSRGSSGIRSFAVDHAGDVIGSPNGSGGSGGSPSPSPSPSASFSTFSYSGLNGGPGVSSNATDASIPDNPTTYIAPMKSGVTAVDGNIWITVGN